MAAANAGPCLKCVRVGINYITMDKALWKHYEDNALTHSAAHYLMTIRELLEENGYARVTDIAKRMNITRGSCSISLKPLKKRGLVVEDHNKFLRLSDEGKRLAEIVEQNDELLEKFFSKVLGVDGEQAEIDACKIEHLLSLESSMKLLAFMECISEEGPGVKAFFNELGSHKTRCTHDVESCTVCRTVCFMEPQENT